MDLFLKFIGFLAIKDTIAIFIETLKWEVSYAGVQILIQ